MSDSEIDESREESPERERERERGWGVLKQHILDNKVNAGLWITRVFTMMFIISYLIPVFGNPYNTYYKALLSNAATSALRLHQRVPHVERNLQFLEHLLMEDSCHYLFYSLIFAYAAPVTLVLAPIFLFALIHVASYTLTLLDCLGQNSWWVARFSIYLVEFESRKILRLCALCEILILPFTAVLVLTGHAGLLTPLIYYQFLKLRLRSQRNPFPRNVFYELRNELSKVSQKPTMAVIVRRMINGLLSITEHMAPMRQ